MKQEKVLQLLKQFKKENSDTFEIITLGLFGSVARDEATEESDIDVFVETKQKGLYPLVHIKNRLESLLHHSVDVIRYRESMNPYLKENIEQDAIYV